MTYTTEFIFSGIISCIIILAVTNFSSFHNRKFKYGVIGYTICLMAVLTEHWLEYSGYYCDFPHMIFSSTTFYFLMGPLLNIVITTTFEQPLKRKQILLEMLIPLGITLWMIQYFVLPGDEKCRYLQNYIACECGMSFRHKSIIVILLIQTAVYSIHWFKKIASYSSIVRNRSSSSTIEFIPWILRTIMLIIIFGLSIIMVGMSRLFFEENFYLFDQIQNTILSFIPHSFLILLFFLHDKRLPQLSSQTTDAKSNGQKNINSDHVVQLIELIKSQKLYLNPDLSLNEVASQMGLSRHNLSDLLSNGLQTNFYDFVNKYRIEYAKSLMTSEMINAYSLSGIARESGFNSYVSFYRVFKRMTGMTPSKFINSN